MHLRSILVLALAATAGAQDTFSPPLIGYVADSGVRPIAGTPGAARILPALPLDAPVSKLALAPGHEFGLATLTEGTSLNVVQFGAVHAVAAVGDTCGTFDSVAWNRTATAAAVYSKDCGLIEVITGLPDSPRISTRIEIANVNALALSSDAATVAWSRESETRTSNGNSWPVAGSALAFSPDGSTVAILDRDRKAVSLAAADVTPVPVELTDPADLFFPEQNTLLIADGRAVRSVNTASGESVSTECFCKSSVIEPTAMKSVFRITDLANGSVWLFERGDDVSRTVFAPVQPAEGEE